MKMISCSYYMLSSKKYALTRLCAGFLDRIFLYELEVDFVQTQRYRCYTHPGLNAVPGVVFQFLLLKSICCYHVGC